jgi:hypothetical protein
MTASIISYAKLHQQFGKAWRSRAMEPARRAIARALHRAVDRGVLSPHLDLNVIEAMLLGPLVYAQVFQSERGTANPDMGHKIAEAFVRAYATPDATHKYWS